MVSVSVVSHRQAELVAALLADLHKYCRPESTQVILTLNLEEPLPFRPEEFAFDLNIVRNEVPQGFGANHNAAARRARGEFFCVLNPDVRLRCDPFPPLTDMLRGERIGAVTAQVVAPDGAVEDHAREFPRFGTVLKKAFGEKPPANGASSPDWIAGMFMLFPTALFRQIGGFDERYFLYYEDVDLCARLRAAGYDVRVEPAVQVVHAARRASHRRPRYFLWHLQSMLRFLLTAPRKLPPLA